MRGQSQRHIVLLSIGAFCISFAAIFVKLISPEIMGPTAIGFWRVLLGAIVLFGWASLRKSRLLPGWSTLKWLIVAGFIFFLDLFFWHKSILYSGAGMATILANTQVFSTAVLSFLVFRERPDWRFWAAAISAIGGVVLLIGVGSHFQMSPLYLRGVFFGLLTGVVYANYLVTIKYAGASLGRIDSVVLMAWVSLFSAIFIGIAGLIEGEPMLPPSGYAFGVLLSLAIVAQAFGWWAIASSIPKIEGSHGGLILLLQPVLATAWGILFFAESLTIVQGIGALITLTAIYVGSIRRSGTT